MCNVISGPASASNETQIKMLNKKVQKVLSSADAALESEELASASLLFCSIRPLIAFVLEDVTSASMVEELGSKKISNVKQI